MKAKILMGYVGIGKSYVYSKAKELGLSIMSNENRAEFASNSSDYSDNYIEAIKDNLNSCDLILLDVDKKLMDVLCENSINYYLFYPDIDTTNKRIYFDNIAKEKGEKIAELYEKEYYDTITFLQSESFATSIQIKSAHNINLIDYVVKMFNIDERLFNCRFLVDRSLKSVFSIRSTFSYSDRSTSNELITEGDLITVDYFKNGKYSKVVGKLCSDNIRNQRNMTGISFIRIDASSQYKCEIVDIPVLDIVSIYKGIKEEIVIPDLPKGINATKEESEEDISLPKNPSDSLL